MDATNYPSIKSAFDKIDGKVCITTEGLLMYLTDFELDALCDNIKKILAEHGRYWITLDPEISRIYVDSESILWRENKRDYVYLQVQSRR